MSSPAQTSTLRWDFPSTGMGEEDGLNDPLQKYFEGDHERFVAREAIQNTIDARSDDGKPVVISFEWQNIPSELVPGRHELLDILNRAREYSEGQEGSEEFYTRAIKILNANKISVLKISDSNTTGLNGSDTDTQGSWYRLIRSAGASSIKGAGGGSYGIGKGAPFAASGLRTVFYSTCNSKGEHVFQGKIRISSFKDSSGDVRRGMGMFGIPLDLGVSSVRENSLIPQIFQRENQGTDIYIIGYLTDETSWRTKLIQSVLNNFWAAIHYNELTVKLKDVDSQEEINSGNVRHYLNQNKDYVDKALACYEAVISPDAYVEKELLTLGNVKLWIKLQQDYPKVVQLMRKSKMLIEERKFRILPETYAAVFICDNELGNKKLRTLEPPAHDKWDADLNKAEGKQINKEITDWIKEELRKFDLPSASKPDEIPDLSKFLPKITDRDDETPFSDEAGTPTEEIDEKETYLEKGSNVEKESKPVVVQKQNIAVIKPASLGNSVLKASSNKGINSDGGKHAGDNDGEFKKIDTTKITFRNIMTEPGKYLLVIYPTEDDNGSIKILEVGEDNSYPAQVQAAVDKGTNTPYKVQDSEIKGLQLKAGITQRIEISIMTKRRYVLGVE